MSDEARYTLHDAQRELARRECAAHGHDWDVMEELGVGPIALVCSRCGESRRVLPPGVSIIEHDTHIEVTGGECINADTFTTGDLPEHEPPAGGSWKRGDG